MHTFKGSDTNRNPAPELARPCLVAIACILIAGTFAGCSSVAAYEQADLSRPGMLFSDSPALAGQSSLLSSIEPGTDDRGGATASGCTACR